MPSLGFGKSQTSLLILVGLVSLFMVLWIFSQFKIVRERLKGESELLFASFYKHSNEVKGFFRDALLLSVHQAEKYVASNGGEESPTGFPRTWIVNGRDTSPDVNHVRYFLSKRTLEILKEYVKNFLEIFNKNELIKLEKNRDYFCVDYDVKAQDVFSGKVDEDFNVGAYGLQLRLYYGSNEANVSADIYEKIPQNRFWYLYRGFKDWSSQYGPSLAACVCSCMSAICGCKDKGECSQTCNAFVSCLNSCAKNAAKGLKARFDEYVECEGRVICCHQEKEPCGHLPQSPRPGEDAARRV